MANIFKLSQDWKQIVDMADELDEQTLADTLEAMEGEVSDKVANMVAVVKSIKSEIELAKDFKKDLDERIKTMDNNVKRLNEYILLGVDTAGKPKKGAEHFRKLEIKETPWVKSVWTQYNPPKVEIVDDRLLPADYLEPQPPKPNTKQIAKDWKQKQEQYAQEKEAEMEKLQKMLNDGWISEEEADAMLKVWEEEHKYMLEIQGVNVTQSVGVRYK